MLSGSESLKEAKSNYVLALLTYVRILSLVLSSVQLSCPFAEVHKTVEDLWLHITSSFISNFKVTGSQVAFMSGASSFA